MTDTRNADDLHLRLDELAARIEHLKRRSTARSGVPFAGSTWQSIVAEHRRLEEKLARERADGSSLHGAHADIESLSLSFESFMRSIDSHYAEQTGR